MTCTKCGHTLPADSLFCQYCGAKIEIAPQEEPITACEPPAADTALQETGKPAAPVAVPAEKAEITAGFVFGGSKKPNARSKQKQEKPKRNVWIGVLSVLLALTVLLNIAQLFLNIRASNTISAQTTQIEKLESDSEKLESANEILRNSVDIHKEELAEKEKTISTQRDDIELLESSVSNQRTTIELLRKKTDIFNDLCTELSSGNIGYASSNFKASESVILVKKATRSRRFTLTASWSGGGTIYTKASSNAANVVFDDKWKTSTTIDLTIVPYTTGVTAITFSNDVNTKTFKVIIIVIE